MIKHVQYLWLNYWKLGFIQILWNKHCKVDWEFYIIFREIIITIINRLVSYIFMDIMLCSMIKTSQKIYDSSQFSVVDCTSLLLQQTWLSFFYFSISNLLHVLMVGKCIQTTWFFYESLGFRQQFCTLVGFFIWLIRYNTDAINIDEGVQLVKLQIISIMMMAGLKIGMRKPGCICFISFWIL